MSGEAGSAEAESSAGTSIDDRHRFLLQSHGTIKSASTQKKEPFTFRCKLQKERERATQQAEFDKKQFAMRGRLGDDDGGPE